MPVVYKKTFSEGPKLEEMLILRRFGWTYHALARRYRVDFTTVRYHTKKINRVIPLIDYRVLLKTAPSFVTKKKQPTTFQDFLAQDRERRKRAIAAQPITARRTVRTGKPLVSITL